MDSPRSACIARELRKLTGSDPFGPLSDQRLLECFAQRGDADAFAVLVRRHGPLVLRVCRGVLRHHQDAEDAFQATFLVLARKAGSIRKQQSVGSWLYGVAYRLARNARVRAARRSPVGPCAAPQPGDPLNDLTWRELREGLHEELNRLPDKYRAPLLMCYWEGQTYEEAAAQLGWKKGTVKERLERGRALLRGRLARRGLGLSVALPAAMLAPATAAPPGLVQATARLAVRNASATAASPAPPGVLALANGALEGMAPHRLRLAALLLLALGAVAGGVGLTAKAPGQPDSPEALSRATEPRGSEAAEKPRADRHGDALPAGALVRLGTTRLRLANGAKALAFSPDGKSLASASDDGASTVSLWDAATGKELTLLRGHRNTIRALAFAPDGKTLATGSNDRTIRLWDVATGKELRRSEATAEVSTIAFSPDGKTLASGGEDPIQLWDPATGKLLRRLDGLPKANGLAFSPDGAVLASTGEGKAVRLWDAATGKLLRAIDGHTELSRNVTFAPDGKSLASGGYENNGIFESVRLWDAATGQQLRQFNNGHQALFSPDGKFLAFSTGVPGGAVRVWETAGGKPERPVGEGEQEPLCFAIAPDSRTVATTGHNQIRLWDLADGKELLSPPGPRDPVRYASFSPDGQTVITGTVVSNWGSPRSAVYAWDSATGAERLRFEHGSGPLSPLTSAPNGTALALYCAADQSVRLWDVVRNREVSRLEGLPREDLHALFTPDGKALITGHTKPSRIRHGWTVEKETPADREPVFLRVWDVGTGKKVRQIGPPLHEALPLSFSPDGKVLVAYCVDLPGGELRFRFWDVATGEEALTRGDRPTMDGLPVFSPDGKHLAAKAFPTGLSVWDLPSGLAPRHLGEGYEVAHALTFSPDGTLLAGLCRKPADAPEKRTLRLWDVATGTELGRFGEEQGIVTSFTFSPDGKTVACCGPTPAVQLWEVASGKERGRFEGHRGPIHSVAFSADNRRLVSASQDTTALIWDLTGAGHGDRSTAPLTPERLKSLWIDLAGDARGAYRAIQALAASPEQSVPFLKERQPPAAPADPRRLARLLADLDNEHFETRERASAELGDLGAVAEAALRKAVEGQPSPEVRRRVEEILADLPQRRASSVSLRELRVVEVLELASTAEARRLLARLADGAPATRLTREARAALARLTSASR
jgi:RNA polymerase sigma factor (sigma-70 family)